MTTQMSRRSWLKWSGAVTCSAPLLTACAPKKPERDPLPVATDGMAGADRTVWSSCNINCGSRCPLRMQVKDGMIVRVLPDDTGGEELGGQQVRACVRGRSIRQRVYNADRLKRPLKRKPGTKRGDEQWEEISWAEAIALVGDKLKETIEQYSNEAIYFHYGSGATGGNISKRGTWMRFLASIGGYLHNYGTYSTAQISAATPFHYGGVALSNSHSDAKNARLQVLFSNPVETRMSGGGELWVTQKTKHDSSVRTIVIDPRYSETAMAIGDEWVPIRPGTDAALVAGMVHVMLAEDLHDQTFLDACCIGFDEDHMPAGIPAGNSYRAYIEGVGRDGVEKTPEWAAAITGVPAGTIRRLAREIAGAKPCAISQGWGVQRQANGENSCRAIMTLSNVTGNVGLKGGGNGCSHGNYSLAVAAFDSAAYYTNPVKTRIPCFTWYEAIDHGPEMTATNAGIRGAERLKHGIKFLVSYSSNTLTNQHSDINGTIELLRDESKCPFILAIDNMYVHSVRYADLILPDTLNVEQPDLVPGGYAGDMGYLIYAQQVIEPMFDTRTGYQMCSDIASYLERTYGTFQKDGARPFADLVQRFTQGRTQEEWVSELWRATKAKVPELPSEAQLKSQGVFRKANPAGTTVAMAAWRADPVGQTVLPNPQLAYVTDPHKIHIFSEKLWEIAHTWELPEGDQVTALPEYLATWEGAEAARSSAEFPLQMISHHYKGRTHSSYANNPWIQEAHPQKLWLNPADATERGIANGDLVRAWNRRGEMHIRAYVTPRIMPGVASCPQGAWYTPSKTERDAQGRPVDVGGSANLLSRAHPSPLAKGNPQHTQTIQVRKV